MINYDESLNKINNIKIGSMNYKIVFKDKVVDDNNQEINGVMLYDSERIEINKRLTLNVKKVILLHEILHAILEKSGIDSSEDNMEQIITAISNNMIDVFNEQENKHIRNFLFHVDKS